jgi:uncharacterized membrane protein (UPF0127 family)
MTSDQNFIARDLGTGRIVANRVTVASTRVDRAIGLLGRTHLEAGEGLWIIPCHGVHTCFMRFSIDVLALDEAGFVVDAVSMLKPWRFRLPKPGAHSVLELPAGTLLNAQTRIGHRITIQGWNSAFTPSPVSNADSAAILTGQTGK